MGVGHYFGLVRVDGSVLGIILGGWGWVEVGRTLFWVGEGEYGWVGMGALFDNAHIGAWESQQQLFNNKYMTASTQKANTEILVFKDV